MAANPVTPTIAEYHRLIDLAMSEEAWQRLETRQMDLMGFAHWHDNDSRHNDASLPDVIAWRDRLLMIENKRMGGILSIDKLVRDTRTGRCYTRKGQAQTILALLDAGQEVYICRPRDWERLVRVLAHGSVRDEGWLVETRAECERRIARAVKRRKVAP